MLTIGGEGRPVVEPGPGRGGEHLVEPGSVGIDLPDGLAPAEVSHKDGACAVGGPVGNEVVVEDRPRIGADQHRLVRVVRVGRNDLPRRHGARRVEALEGRDTAGKEDAAVRSRNDGGRRSAARDES